MRLTYHNLVIELPLEGIKAVESIEISQRLNEHGRAKIQTMVDEEQALELVEHADNGISVSVYRDNGQALFCGKGERISARKEGGLYYLYLEFCGYTRDWDLTEKSQSFCKGNDTYAQVLDKVLSEYPEKEIKDEATGGAKIPGMLLQYEETDWEYLMRLASHFSTFLLTDDTQKHGKVYFGVPRIDKGTVLADEEYTVLRGKECYGGMEEAEELLSQEMTGWRVRTRKNLCFGEQVMLNHIETVVTAVDVYTEQEDIVWEYELSRRKGILNAKKKNNKIYGMSIPATVKERKGNQIRVQFDIDSNYEASDDLKYFTYAIETSNFYCMPEEESRVHIYFPSHDEQDAIAVHALSAGSVPGGSAGGSASNSAENNSPTKKREVTENNSVNNSGGVSYGGGSNEVYSGGFSAGTGAIVASATETQVPAAADLKEQEKKEEKAKKEKKKKNEEKVPDYKQFSDPSGSYLELAPYGITLSVGRNAALVMDAGGTLALDCSKINLMAGTNIYMGGTSEGPISEILATARTEMKVALSGGQSSITLNKDTDIVATFIKMNAELKKEALPLASEVEAELIKGDQALRDNYNTNAVNTLTALAVKKIEGKRKFWDGVTGVLEAVALLSLVAFTGGACAPLVGVVIVATGSFMFTSGTADIAEGISDYNKADSGDLSQSYNMARDSIIFKGDESLYQQAKFYNKITFEIVTTMNIGYNIQTIPQTSRVGILLARVSNLCQKSKVVDYGISIGGDVISTAVNDLKKTGTIDPVNIGLSIYSGVLKGMGIEVSKGLTSSVENTVIRKSLSTILGAATGMGVDHDVSNLKGEEYDPLQSLGQNVLQAGLANVFGEPIDAASGAFMITENEIILPDIVIPLYLTRKYFSVSQKVGWLGKGWHFSYEGRLCYDGKTIHAELPDGYCAAYMREESEGETGIVTYRDIAGNNRYLLSHDEVNSLWNIMDTHLYKTYCYNGAGLLFSVFDKNGCSVDIEYDGEFPTKLTTALGYEVHFTFKAGRLVRMEDGIGRVIQYHYENDLLAEVVHVDGGITHYAYTEDGYLSQPTDQTGVTYLTNCYDEKGRVTLQTLANGDTYTVEYSDRKRQVSMEYSGCPGKTIYTYNEKMAVTSVLHPDGMEETFVYDAKNNRIQETDKEGRITRREYDNNGHLIKEVLPEGLEKEYHYDKKGDLIKICDNGGREKILSYDGLHNLILRSEKTAEGEWREERFTWDIMGRLVEQEDGEGHLTRYCYDRLSAYPFRTIYPDGSELLCEYDTLGRKLAEEDSVGRSEYAYNRNGWQTMERDGSGNEIHRLYDGRGRLTALYSPKQWSSGDGQRTEYRYDFLKRLTETIYADDSHEKQFRDGEGNIIKKVHPNAYDPQTENGDGTYYEYDWDGNVLCIRYPDGGVERFFYDGMGNRTKHVLPEQYDPETDDGAGWCYAYDKENRLISVTGPDGIVEESYAYDLWGNCVQKTNAEGYSTYYTYDLAGRLTEMMEPAGKDDSDLYYRMTRYEYDRNGNRIKEIRYGGRYRQDGTLLEAGTDLILTFGYDARNRLVRVEDGLGARATYRYDDRGNRISEEQLVGESMLRRIRYAYDEAGRLIEKRELLDSGLAEDKGEKQETAVTRYSYDANGNQTGIITPVGYHISREYDSRDRLSAERLEDKANDIDLKTIFTYDQAGNVTSVKQQSAEGQTREISCSHDLKDRLTRVEELDGPVILASYDTNDKMVGRQELLPSEAEQYRDTRYSYDIKGNLLESLKNGKSEQRNEYDRSNRLIGNTDADGVEVHCRYGLQDEQREITTAGSRKQNRAVQTLSYNARGMVTGVEDGCGNSTGYTLDAWGRITAVETADGGREEYAYDPAGNITETVDANGGSIRYDYDSRGNICKITDQSGNSETFRYDKEGRQVQHTDRKGTVTETSYNVYGKPVMQSCTDRQGRRQVMGTWEYDSFGQLKRSVAGGFCYTYEYRPDGKLLHKWNSGKQVISCDYYKNGSLKSLTDVSGKTAFYEYDGDGRLKYLKDDNEEILTEYIYTSAGRVREIITAGGIKTSYSYDEDGNISRLTIGDGTEEGLLYDAFMLYDLNGNRLGKTGQRMGVEGKQEMNTVYCYDPMNRLTMENRREGGEKYAYDLCGNRLKKQRYHYALTTDGSMDSVIDDEECYCYNERNELTERVRAGSLTAYIYDANGSLISEEAEGKKSEYHYDLLNRQSYVRMPDGREQENRYDGEGFRAGLTENGKSTTFLFHNGEILTECDGDSMPIRRHVRGLGLSHVQTLDDDAYHMYHQDEQGSTAYVTGSKGGTENLYGYDAFGNLLEKREGVENRILYTGQQYDQETEQYYLRARYYNPVIGRFMQEDTYRGDGLNLYAYCANNPVIYYDPSGHSKQEYNDDINSPNGTPGGNVDNGISAIPDLSNKAVKHPMNDHMPSRYAQQLGYLSREEVERQLQGTTFFNPNWTDEQVREALNFGYKEALSNNFLNGNYEFTFLGDKVTIFLDDGIFHTGYGDYTFTYDQLFEIFKSIGGK